jgi:hypothetical protein
LIKTRQVRRVPLVNQCTSQWPFSPFVRYHEVRLRPVSSHCNAHGDLALQRSAAAKCPQAPCEDSGNTIAYWSGYYHQSRKISRRLCLHELHGNPLFLQDVAPISHDTLHSEVLYQPSCAGRMSSSSIHRSGGIWLNHRYVLPTLSAPVGNCQYRGPASDCGQAHSSSCQS